MASGSLSTEELAWYGQQDRLYRDNLFTNIGRHGLVLEPGTPVYERFEDGNAHDIARSLDGAIEMHHRTLVSSIGLHAMRRSDEGHESWAPYYDAIWQRASDFLTGQQGSDAVQ